MVKKASKLHTPIIEPRLRAIASIVGTSPCELGLTHSVARKQDFEIATEASIGTEIRSPCVSPVLYEVIIAGDRISKTKMRCYSHDYQAEFVLRSQAGKLLVDGSVALQS